MTASRRRSGLLLLPVLVLLLTACSDDGEAAPDPDPSDSETGSASATPTDTQTGGFGAATPTASSGSPGPSGPDPEVDLGSPPASYAEGVAHVEAALAVADVGLELSRFVTPTGNIYCVVDDPGLPPACEIGEGAERRVDVCGADAPSQLVGRVELVDGVATAVCNTDTIRTGDAPTLGYGGVATWAGSPVQCVVEELGVTCLDTDSQAGFFVSRGRFRLLG